MADKPIEIQTDAASLGLLTAVNILADVLITEFPHLQPGIETRVRLKLDEWRADPATAPHTEGLAQILRALVRSDRALERAPPKGRA